MHHDNEDRHIVEFDIDEAWNAYRRSAEWLSVKRAVRIRRQRRTYGHGSITAVVDVGEWTMRDN